MTVSKVALLAADDYEPAKMSAAVENIFSQFQKQINISRGDRVLLKPNFIAPREKGSPAITDPALIAAVGKAVIDMEGKPFVADSTAWGDTYKCIEQLGCGNEFAKIGIGVQHLGTPIRTRIDGARIGLSKLALDADAIINIPKFKAHQQLGATFAIKNLYGTVCGKEKAIRHMTRGRDRQKFCRMIVEIYQTLSPMLTIIDGITAMEGMGPLNGTPKHLGAIIAGVDPVACERVCAELVGFEPNDLPLLKMAEEMGVGCGDLAKIEVIGETIENLKCKDFEPAMQTPLHFSFPRICKSLTKQLIIKIKAKFA